MSPSPPADGIVGARVAWKQIERKSQEKRERVSVKSAHEKPPG